MDQFICTGCAHAIENGDGKFSDNLVLDSYEPEFRDWTTCTECSTDLAGDYFPVHYN